MKRLHLFEFEDQAWLPSSIRDGMTDYLTFLAEQNSKPFRGFSERLNDVLQRTGSSTIVELGTGGGGPALAIGRELEKLGRKDVRFVLTDLYPSLGRLRQTRDSSNLAMEIIEDSINAVDVPDHLKGVRVLCNAFHHLPEEIAKGCLKDAVVKQQAIGVMEFVGRTPLGFFQLVALLPLMFFAMPFIKPFRVSRIFFTYVIPVIPILTLWDGIVSCLRVYSPDELRALVGQLPANDYTWDIGRMNVPQMPVQVTYLIGLPKRQSSEAQL